MIKPISSIGKSSLLGVMLATSVCLGAQDNKKGVVNKSDEISYEHNVKLDERVSNENISPEQINNLYKELGTYGATIELQRLKNGYVTNVVHPMLNNLSDSQFWDVYDNCFSKFPAAVQEYIAETKAKTAAELYNKKGVPSAKECSDYIEKQILDDNSLSQSDYNKYKKDIKRFKKAQGNVITNQSVAELIAYKQYKLDSLAYRKMLDKFGFLKNDEVKKLFEKDGFPKYASPKP